MYTKDVSWTVFKQFVSSKNLLIQYLEMDSIYEVLAIDGVFILVCRIDRQNTNSDLLDFETNFKPSANKPIEKRSSDGLLISKPFKDAVGFRFRGASFKASVPANATQDVDYKIEQERWIDGGRALVDKIGSEDQITFQVVDKDNILGMGAGTVLDEFISGYYVPMDGNLEVRLPYPARIVAGLYLRLKYTSTHSEGCTLKCNLYLHWKAM